jgi:hypothetical protein
LFYFIEVVKFEIDFGFLLDDFFVLDRVSFVSEFDLVACLQRNLIETSLGEGVDQIGKAVFTGFSHFNDFLDGDILAFGYFEVTEFDGLVNLVYFFSINFSVHGIDTSEEILNIFS